MQMKVVKALFLACLILSLAACGGAGGSQNGSGGTTTKNAATFVTADDFPLPAVLGFNVTVNSIVLNGASSSTSNLLAQPETVDFARLIGLRNLLAFNSVPAGTYSGMTIQLQSPIISALNLGTAPPSTTSLNGSWASGVSVQNGVATITVPLRNNLVLDGTNLVGLHMHFDLRQSLQTDTTGQVTGVVDPKITANVVNAGDDDAVVTDLRGSIVSVDVPNNTFIVQKWDGQQVTVRVNAQTVYNSTNTLATFTPGMVVEVQGSVQNDGSILASSVDVASIERVLVEGTIIYVDPNGTNITLLPNAESVAIPGVTLETPVTIDISTVQHFTICGIDNWLSNFVFDGSSLIAGQRIAVSGIIDTGTNPPAFVPQRIRLQRQGVSGSVVLNSVNAVNGNAGTFQLQNNALVGYVINGPLTIETTNSTKFIGVSGLSGIANGGNMQLEVRGLLLKNPTTGVTTFYAHWVKVVQ
ncbi:MAG: DUF5666 domain-containing protein [Terriglobales bacterium]